jgi:aspartate aminotransferase
MQLSRRVSSLKPSSTLAVTNQAKQMQRAGVDVLSFAAGEPDFDTPEAIKEAAIAALREGMTKYAPVPGDPDARAAIAEKLRVENGIPDITPEHVVVTVGGKSALYLLFQALLDPPVPGAGPDEKPWEVLLPTPAWVSYPPQVELAGGVIRELPTEASGDFKVTPAQVRGAMTERTRVILINSPSNPCGTMYSPAEIHAIADAIVDGINTVSPHCIVISDEIYEKIVYGPHRHLSIGSIPAIAERVVTVNGLSKAYSMTGWRLGYLAGSGKTGLDIAKACATMQSQMTTSPTTFAMAAIPTALLHSADEVERMRKAFAKRAALIYRRLSAMPGLVCPEPTGAFYAFPDVSAHFGKTSAGGRSINSSLDFCAALLAEHQVAAVPGEDFLGCGPRCVRFSFACSEEHIERGMDRLAAFLDALD